MDIDRPPLSTFERGMKPGHRARSKLVALGLLLSIGAAACGGGETAAPELGSAPQPSAPSSGADSTSSATSSDDIAGSDASTGSDAPTDDSGAAADAGIVNLFPDLDVVNVADGNTVNLASELGGGERATLLWFWAPH